MQQRLFDQRADIDHEFDPYEDLRGPASTLAKEYGIDPEQALDMILSFGSEAAARRALDQRWWLGEKSMAA